MFPSERRKRITEFLRVNGFCTVTQLAEAFAVSDATIQRDLFQLKEQGVIKRLYGGVTLNSAIETRFDIRLRTRERAKRLIAAKALSFLEMGDSIFLDASTTCAIFAQEMSTADVPRMTVVTTSPTVLTYLYKCPQLHVISCGGKLEHDFCALSGKAAYDFLAQTRFDKAFVSAGGLSVQRGLTTGETFIQDTLRTVIRVAREVDVLLDSSKFNKECALTIAPMDVASRIITDGPVPPDIETFSREKGIELVLARVDEKVTN